MRDEIKGIFPGAKEVVLAALTEFERVKLMASKKRRKEREREREREKKR